MERAIIKALIERSRNNLHLYYFDKEKEMYKQKLQVTPDVARKLVEYTCGYAYAYQSHAYGGNGGP